MMTVATPHPVATTDGQVRVLHELLMVNAGSGSVTVSAIEVLGESGTVLSDLRGEALAAIVQTPPGLILQPFQSGIAFLDVAVATDAIPAVLRHRITTRGTPGSTGSHSGPPVQVVTGSPVALTAHSAPVLAPPVRGDRWVAFRGCCAPPASHRASFAAHDGWLSMPERFAIDLIRMEADGRMITGAPELLSSYPQYGATVHAVADGVVVATHDGEPDQVPGALPEGLRGDAVGGNRIMMDIGAGHYAYYAHLQPGSVRVRPGDRVATGQVLGLIGNSGNTFGPHLHFHVGDRPHPLAADGRPYVFDSLTVRGRLAANALEVAYSGQAVPINPTSAGHRAGKHPLNNEVIDFRP